MLSTAKALLHGVLTNDEVGSIVSPTSWMRKQAEKVGGFVKGHPACEMTELGVKPSQSHLAPQHIFFLNQSIASLHLLSLAFPKLIFFYHTVLWEVLFNIIWLNYHSNKHWEMHIQH